MPPRVSHAPSSAETRELRPRYRQIGVRAGQAVAAPVFHPTEAEFADFASYVSRIATACEPFGICKIVPPESWNGPAKAAPPPSYKLESAIAQHATPSAEVPGLYSFIHETVPGMTFDKFKRDANSASVREHVRAGLTHDELEERFWAELAYARTSLYGADLVGTRFPPDVNDWNLNTLPDMLREGPAAIQGDMHGINTPMLYFGRYRALFCMHTEDMDLVSGGASRIRLMH